MRKKMDRIFQDSSYEILRRMLGRKLISVMHAEREMSAIVIGIIQFNLEGYQACLNSDTDVIEYFGAPEDVIALYMTDGAYKFPDPVLHSHSVGKTIESISVVNHHTLSRYIPKNHEYQYDLTAAVIFKFEDGSELSFERLDDFIEMIIVKTGEKLIEKLQTPGSYYEENEIVWQYLEKTTEVVELKR